MLYICEWMAPSRAFYEGRDSHQGTHPSDNFGLGTKSKNLVSSPLLPRSLGWGRLWPRSRFDVVSVSSRLPTRPHNLSD